MKKWENYNGARNGDKNSVNNQFTTQKNNYLRAQAKKANLERTRGSCSSEKEHKVNALAPRAEEGRDNLR